MMEFACCFQLCGSGLPESSIIQLYTPPKLTCPLKSHHVKRKVVFQPSIFWKYVSFRLSISYPNLSFGCRRRLRVRSVPLVATSERDLSSCIPQLFQAADFWGHLGICNLLWSELFGKAVQFHAPLFWRFILDWGLHHFFSTYFRRINSRSASCASMWSYVIIFRQKPICKLNVFVFSFDWTLYTSALKPFTWLQTRFPDLSHLVLERSLWSTDPALD